ncbi:MAG: hypothetical protein V1747_05240 [Candidatus Omnitrophota bacterium]
MRKNNLLIFITAIVALCMAIIPAYAWQNDGKSDKDKGGLEAKFLGKIKSLSAHQEMLDLNDQQIKQIKDLHISTKKELIRSNAEIEIVSIDIKSNLFDTDKIDLKIMEKLIDEKYKIKKDQAKILVKAFAQIQNILTKEQKDTLKNLKFEMNQPYSKSMKCDVGKSMGMCPKMKAPEAMSK